MAGFDYLIDSEYSGAPGNSFLFNFLQIFAGGTVVFVSYGVPWVRTPPRPCLRRGGSRTDEQHVVVTGQRRRKRRVTRINSYSTTTTSVMDRSKAESVSSIVHGVDRLYNPGLLTKTERMQFQSDSSAATDSLPSPVSVHY